MQLVKSSFKKDGEGFVELVPEESDDLWHLYNLVLPGDEVTTVTFRKVQKERMSGIVCSKSKKLVLTLAVKNVDYDVAANEIRFSGRNKTESEDIKLNQFHTHTVGLGTKMTLWKNNWDFIVRRKLKEASELKKSAEVAVILIDRGLANLYLITALLMRNLSRIEVNIPKRRAIGSGHDKSMEKFFRNILAAIVQHVNFEVVQCVVLAGPGFIADDFMKWMNAEVQKQSLTKFVSHQNIFISCKATSAHKQALNEVLADQTIASRIASTKAAKSVAALDEFYKTMQATPELACYGPLHVEFAVSKGAVKTLMVTDRLFRSADISERRRYVDLTETAQSGGSEVLIFSDMHVNGEQLQQLSGIAAILRFPVPGMDEVEDLLETEEKQIGGSSE